MIDTLLYVINGQSFWLSMGCTSAVGVFIGALLYNGDLKLLQKGILTIGIYVFFLLHTTFVRLLGTRNVPIFERAPQSTASIVTILLVTLFYIFGMFIGVAVLSYTKKIK